MRTLRTLSCTFCSKHDLIKETWICSPQNVLHILLSTSTQVFSPKHSKPNALLTGQKNLAY